ncbi:hypothetical protein LSH36_615g00000 [Paralvinella palmiformis]|uniref:Uncharacterized protein n=1 Tax=Paralvinella palmiformis TaxID=53620 RepID=A0AAD9MW56_9ANNE|nr:hypothetical protein LSH36_615g00000 [Paralvinella palmiformis]
MQIGQGGTLIVDGTVCNDCIRRNVFRTLPHTSGKHRELFLIPMGRLNLILEDTSIVLGKINLYYTFCWRAFFDVLLVCHLLEDQLHCIINFTFFNLSSNVCHRNTSTSSSNCCFP